MFLYWPCDLAALYPAVAASAFCICCSAPPVLPAPPQCSPCLYAPTGSPAYSIFGTAVLEVAAQPAREWLAQLYASPELAAAAAEGPVVLVSWVSLNRN